MAWAKLIRQALHADSFSMVCDPIVRGPGQTVAGLEFLLRLKQDGFAPSASTLLRAAERYSLAPELDRMVVTTVLTQLEQHLPLLDRVEFFCLNVSGQSLGRPEFMDFVEQRVRESSVPSTKLCFEITETSAIANLGAASQFMQRLRAIGCKIALDDFGSGLSSFHYLKHLPCDLLKIDGAFMRDIVPNESDRSLVSAIHGIAKLFGLATVAEHVENDGINEVVQKIGVDYRQGHLFGKALPIAEALADLRPASRQTGA